MEEASTKPSRTILYTILLLAAIALFWFFMVADMNSQVQVFVGVFVGIAFLITSLVYQIRLSRQRHKELESILVYVLGTGWFALLGTHHLHHNRPKLGSYFVLIAIGVILSIAWRLYARLKAREQTS